MHLYDVDFRTGLKPTIPRDGAVNFTTNKNLNSTLSMFIKKYPESFYNKVFNIICCNLFIITYVLSCVCQIHKNFQSKI